MAPLCLLPVGPNQGPNTFWLILGLFSVSVRFAVRFLIVVRLLRGPVIFAAHTVIHTPSVSLAAPASPPVPSGTAEEGKKVMTVQLILGVQVWLGSNKEHCVVCPRGNQTQHHCHLHAVTPFTPFFPLTINSGSKMKKGVCQAHLPHQRSMQGW
jgi:hypothetical protein